MNKLLTTLLAGLVVTGFGLNAIAADAAQPDTTPVAQAAKEKPAAPAKKAHRAKKMSKKDAAAPTTK